MPRQIRQCKKVFCQRGNKKSSQCFTRLLSLKGKSRYDYRYFNLHPLFRRGFMSDHITNISDSSFDQDVLQADGPVLVDYWAEWCGPCKMIAPVLEDVAVEFAGKVKICKLNIDDNQATPPTRRAAARRKSPHSSWSVTSPASLLASTS